MPSLMPFKDADSLQQGTQPVSISTLMTILPFEIIIIFQEQFFLLQTFM